MTQLYYRRNEIDKLFEPCSWQTIVFREFSTSLLGTARPFPCVFGVVGFEADQLRFSFIDRMEGPDLSVVLQDYLKNARSFGQNTSLVAFSRPGPVRGLESYRKRFWTLIRNLSAHDSRPWPSAIPNRLDNPLWEFCFAGERVFVVCNTPAHVLRQSRRSSTFMLTFQPSWVFEKILETPKTAKKVFGKVRRRLAAYDMLPPSPALGQYGDPNVFEYQQYFLSDNNEHVRCPFTSLKEKKLNTEFKLEKIA